MSNGQNLLDYQFVKYKSVIDGNFCIIKNFIQKLPKYKDCIVTDSNIDSIMKDLGYWKVYHCGKTRWEYLMD